jgi:signal transduction histidine kinase
MRERATTLGAPLSIQSNARGTRIALALPLRCLRRRANRPARS